MLRIQLTWTWLGLFGFYTPFQRQLQLVFQPSTYQWRGSAHGDDQIMSIGGKIETAADTCVDRRREWRHRRTIAVNRRVGWSGLGRAS